MPSAIYYGLIARQGVVLCYHATVAGNFERISQSILDQKTGSSPTKISYESGRYLFHVLVSSGLTYMCVTDSVFDRGVAFGCLYQLERELTSRVDLRERALTSGQYHCLQEDFSDVLASLIKRYSSSDKMANLEDKVATVKGVMTKSIDKVMKRGENLDDLTERSELLHHSSNRFRRSSTKLRRKLCCQTYKMWILFITIIVIILAIIIAIVVGLVASGVFKKKDNN